MQSLKARTLICLPLLLSALSAPSLAGTISLRWSAVPGATGYRLHHGSAPGEYGASVDVGNTLEATLSGLPDCAEHYVAVKAYNAAGESPTYSNEISGWPRPAIGSSEPSQLFQGGQYTLTILGSNFEPGAQLFAEIPNLPTDPAGDPLLRIDSVVVRSCNEIQAFITVEPTAAGQRAMPVGDFIAEVEVRNPDSVFGSNGVSLQVQFAEARADINRSNLVTRDRVDGRDLVWLAHAYASEQGDPNYNPDADLDGSGLVDGQDLVYLATRFGRCWQDGAWSAAACP